MDTNGSRRWNFTAKWKMGNPFSITDSGLIHGGIEYPFSRLSTISLINAPANSLLNGVAQVTVDHSTVLQLHYEYSQHHTFLIAMEYANEQINNLSASKKAYKYLLQAADGNKVEVYENYLVLYFNKTNFLSAFAIGEQNMDTTRAIAVEDLISVHYTEPSNQLPGTISFLDNIMPQPDKKNTISVSAVNAAAAQAISDYLNRCKETGEGSIQAIELPHMTYEPFKGEARAFSLAGTSFNVPVEFDILNTYRTQYRKLAAACADRFKQMYQMCVHDYTSFVSTFEDMYVDNMAPLVYYSMDILVAEGIWTVTKDAFVDEHTKKYYKAYDFYRAIYDAGVKTIEKNMVSTAKATYTPRIGRTITIGSFSDALGTMLQKEAYNKVADYITKKAVGSTTMNTAQQLELYNRIDLNNLVLLVYCDYSNMWITLGNMLIKNGHNLISHILPNNDNYTSLFENLSNPHFPKDKIAPALLEMIQAQPYKKAYYQFMKDHFGETEEVEAICNYFDFGDLNNPYKL